MDIRNILSAAVLASLLSACNVDVPNTEPPPVPLPVGAMHVTSYDSELIRAEIRVYPVDDHLQPYGDPWSPGRPTIVARFFWNLR